jgi:hypothetical protein
MQFTEETESLDSFSSSNIHQYFNSLNQSYPYLVTNHDINQENLEDVEVEAEKNLKTENADLTVLDEKKTSKKVSRKKIPSKKYIDYETESHTEIDTESQTESQNENKKVLGKRKYTKKNYKNDDYDENKSYKNNKRERNRKSAYEYRVRKSNEFNQLTSKNHILTQNYDEIFKKLTELKTKIEHSHITKNDIIKALNNMIISK